MDMFFLPKEPTYFFRSRIQDERMEEAFKDFEQIGKFDDVEVYRYFIRAMPKTSLPIGDFDENGQRKPDGKLYNLGIKSSHYPNPETIEQWANDKEPQLKKLITDIEDGCKNEDAFEEAFSSIGGLLGFGDSDSDDDFGGMRMMHPGGFGGGRGRVMNAAAERRREERKERNRLKEEKKRQKDL